MAALKHLKPGSRGHCLISPLEALEAVYKDWKANLGMFVKPALLPPEEGWLAKFDSSQVNLPKNADCAAKDLGFQAIRQREAWINLMRRRNLKPDAREDRQWQKDSKSWKLLQRAVDLIRPSAFSWTVFAPPALQGGGRQKPCSSLEDVRQWSKANEPGDQPKGTDFVQRL